MTTDNKNSNRWTCNITGQKRTTRQLALELRDDAKTDFEMRLGFEISNATALRLTLDSLASIQAGLYGPQEAQS